jgi:hypothetical protein
MTPVTCAYVVARGRLAELAGVFDYWRRPVWRESWAFNGQEFRRRLFTELSVRVPFVAIIETGTSFGTTTKYLRHATHVTIYSFETDPRRYGFARANLLALRDLQPSGRTTTMDSVVSRDREKAVSPAHFLMRAWVLSARHKFSCFLGLGEHALELVPRKALALLENNPETDLVVNPSFRYQRGSELPAEIRQRALPLNACLRGYPIAWIEDPRAGVWIPFWASGEYADVLPLLRPGEPSPSGLRGEIQRALTIAEILVPGDYGETWRARRERTVQTMQSPFRTDGYAIVRDLIHPLQLGALRRHYRALLAGGDVPKGDWLEDRYGFHSELMASFLHQQLGGLVSQIAAEPVKPSFVYFGSYRPGAVLPRHLDRPQCQFSISLLVDYSPEPDGPCGWPLYLENPSRPEATVAADLAMGDGAFYRGQEVFHYRHALPEGHRAALPFLNYVREDFAGRLW